jgi:hypothetical protein
MLFVIKSSKTYVLMLFAVHLLAIVSVCLMNLVVWARLCLALLIAASLLHQLYRHLGAGDVWRSLFLDQKLVVVTTRSGLELNGSVMHQTVVTPCCVVLCAKLDGYKFPVCQVVFRDAMQHGAFRELRVRLKFS